jgi:hypothetical protein
LCKCPGQGHHPGQHVAAGFPAGTLEPTGGPGDVAVAGSLVAQGIDKPK